MQGWNAGLEPKPLKVFGGLVTNQDRMDLPDNVSPANQNVVFQRAVVESRKGTSVLTGTPLTGDVNGMFTYIPIDGTYHLMPFTRGTANTDGNLYYENPAGTFNLVTNTMGANLYMKGDTHYGRAWMAFHDGQFGVSHPRKYDGTTLSRIGTERPSWTGSVIEAAGAGQFSAGYHRVRVSFETDAGFTTPPSKVGIFLSGGGASKGATLSLIPLGPTGTIRRVIWCATVTDSAATDPTGFEGTTQQYYTLRNTNMIIPDNTSTTWTMDGFTDAQLSQGESALDDRIWTIAPIPPCKGMIFYKGRYFYYGLLGSVQPEYVSATALDNYTFDGGQTGADIPYGWGTVSAGGTIATGVSGATGKVWRMTGSGAAAVGGIGTVGDGVHPYSMFTPGINYGVRLRCKKNATLVTGTLRISSTINTVTTNYDVPVSSMGQAWQNFESTTALITGHTNHGDAGPDPITVELIGTPTTGGVCDLDWLDFFDILKPRQGSRVYATFPDSPETVDSETGFIDVSPNDGQDIQSAFVLRDNLYFVKDRSIHVVADNLVTEPAGWSVFKVDDTVGCGGVQAVADGDGWVVIAARSGLYYYDGGKPQKLTQEIQPDWDSINWQYSYAIDVKVDVESKRIYCALPLGETDEPSVLYVMDFLEGFGDPTLGSGVGRKWTKWTILANSLCLAERSNGRRIVLFGSNDATGNILKYDTTTVNDNGAAINAYYDTAPLGTGEGITFFGGILMWVEGSGTFTLSKQTPDNTVSVMKTFTLADPAPRNTQLLRNDHSELLSFRFQTNAIGAYWSVGQFTPYMKPDPFFPVRGYNP